MKQANVSVLALFDEDGGVIPVSVTWSDGRIYSIESVLERRASRTQANRFRYLVRIHGQDVHLYRSKDRWFMDVSD